MKTGIRRSVTGVFFALSALIPAACGSKAAPGVDDVGGNGGGGDADAGPRRDSGVDGGALDAMTGPKDDAGSQVATCDVDPDQLTVQIDGRGSHTWDAVQLGNTIHLAYEVSVCADNSRAQAQRVDYLTFRSTGAFGEAVPVAGHGKDACSYTRTPSLAPGVGEKPVLFYSTNAPGVNDLFQSAIGAATPDLRITTDPDSSSDSEEHTVAVRFGQSNLLAYVNAAAALQGPSVGRIVTRRVGFPEQEILPASSGLHISGLALAAFSGSKTRGGVLSWVADVGPTPGIVAQFLDLSGKPSGEPIVLSDQAGAFSNVSMAMLPKAETSIGAIVYGVAADGDRTGLRFRTIGIDGTFGEEVHLTHGEVNVQGIAIAPFARGYILVFRVIVGADTSLHVRHISVDGSNGAAGERVLVGADTSGDAPKAFITNDGRLTVAFTNITGEGVSLRVVRAICDP